MTISLSSIAGDLSRTGPAGTGRDGFWIAVASGKGGTGKTTVAVNLALTAAACGMRVQFLNCTIGEPNDLLYLAPRIDARRPVTLPLPVVDKDLCDGCGICEDVCEFHAVAVPDGRALISPERCCGCGACILFCPRGALQEGSRTVGIVEKGASGGIPVVQGRLSGGQALVPALIAGIKESAGDADLTILDCPSGTSGPAIEAVRNADLVLFVAEPTSFGLHDLVLATDMAEALGMRFGLVLNRCGDDPATALSGFRNPRIPVIMSIPEDPSFAEARVRGGIPVRTPPSCCRHFSEGLQSIIGIMREKSGPKQESGTV